MPVTLSALFATFFRIGLLSFGGPAAQIALMHRTLVKERTWLAEREFLSATSYCMLLPGPEAMQVATYAGWRLRGIAGGLISGGMFIVPGAIFMGLVATFYAVLIRIDLVQAAFLGVKAAVLIILIQAMGRLAQGSKFGPLAWIIAVMALALLGVGISFPLILLGAYAVGFVFMGGDIDTWPARPKYDRPQFLTFVFGGALWLSPLLFLTGPLWDLGAFFARLAVVSFGGAYVGLTYMVQDLTTQLNMLEQAQLLDGLGLAETTPGPLILVTQFVGHLGAEQAGYWGLWGGLIALWMIFVPSFVLIFSLGPYFPYLSGSPWFSGGAKAISAAVIGLIAALSFWFAGEVLIRPDGTLHIQATILVALAGCLLFLIRLNLPLTLLTCALGGLLCALTPL